MGQQFPYRLQTGARWSAWRLRWLPALALAGFTGLWSAPAAAAITLDSISVERDGSPGTFDADDLPGHDSSPINGWVRTQDEMAFKVSYHSSGTTADTITLQVPQGMRFNESAKASAVCNVSGALNADKTVLTCVRAPVAGIESFTVMAMAGALAHGTDVATHGAGVSGHTASNSTRVKLPVGQLRISAAPQTQVYTLAEQYARKQVGGVNGRRFVQKVYFGASLPARESSVDAYKFKGFEALQTPMKLAIQVMPGALLQSCNPAVVCSQPGGAGGAIELTFGSATRTDFLDPVRFPVTGASDWYATTSTPAVSLEIWTPDGPNFPPGVLSSLQTVLTGFQPLGLSGAGNLSGQPAHDTPGGLACGVADNPRRTQAPSCLGLGVDRRNPLRVQDIPSSAVYSRASYLYGDTHGFVQSAEKVVPGQDFVAMVGRGNSVNSEENLLYSSGCVAWDPKWLELRAAPTLHLVLDNGMFFSTDHINRPAPASGNYVIEYYTGAHANDQERKTFSCGTPGTPASGWGALPADPSVVTAVRYAYEDTHIDGGIPPGSALGLGIPMRRSSNEDAKTLPTDSRLPWFYQYRDKDAGANWVPSTYDPAMDGMATGGGVQSVAARVRHGIQVTPVAAPNETAAFTITPRLIGPPLAGVNTKAENLQVKVSFEAQYLELPSTAPTGVTYFNGNAGPDGIWGTADDVASYAEFKLGNPDALGGPVTAGYQGHMTELAPLTFELHVKADAPQRSYSFRSVISSDSDSSYEDYSGVNGILGSAAAQDRTETTSMVVAGVASFSVSKAVTGGAVREDPSDPTSPWIITAGEPFSYTIRFANVTTAATGPGHFVDVLPFNGDGRGTSGLPSALQLLAVSAEMEEPSAMTISAEYTTDAAAAVLAAVQMPGNEHATSGVHWQSLDAAAIPAAATALRFKTSGNLVAGSKGKISLTLRADGDVSGVGGVVNDLYGRTMDAVDPKVIRGDAVAKIKGARAGASLEGRVFHDANGNGQWDVGEAGISGVEVNISCEAGSSACVAGSTLTGSTDATGAYHFSNLPSGNWTLAIAPRPGWQAIASLPGTVNGAATGTAGVRQITGIAISSASTAVDYQFAERQQLGILTIRKALDLPAGVSGPLAFSFQALCDGQSYTAQISDYPNTSSVTVATALPLGMQCTVTEDALPAAPDGYHWASPSISPAGPVTVTNAGAEVLVTNRLEAQSAGSSATVQLSLQLDLPSGVSDTFSTAVEMTCAGQKHSSVLTTAAAQSQTVAADVLCTVDKAIASEAPAGYTWGAPVINPGSLTTEAGKTALVLISLRLLSDETPPVATATPVPVNAPLALLLASLLLAVGAGWHLQRRQR
ncbi:DUF5979 domain-containing protein [Comamonas sp. J-3]|uniref:DUF5979 domain-containing protein n=1 Tax=Comamonas trifloxystrobinivorans TaxID=3350256 RepID=UPI0037287EBE